MPRYHLDANVVLRFLRNDDPQQSPASARLFAAAKAKKVKLSLSTVTLAEIFYVLARIYKLSRPDAAARLLPLVQSDALDVESRERVVDCLQRVMNASVDFGDAYLAATAAERGDKVSSFDRDLAVFQDVVTDIPR
ncbi:MAG: PIN domain-containing protein [Opitutaceae bacterium]